MVLPHQTHCLLLQPASNAASINTARNRAVIFLILFIFCSSFLPLGTILSKAALYPIFYHIPLPSASTTSAPLRFIR